MSSEVNPSHRIFVSYIDKSREYYLAQGFGNPYRWAYNQQAPFSRLAKPLASARIGVVTTSSLFPNDPAADPAGVAPVVYSASVDPPPQRMYTQHRFWDREATHTDDVDSFLPISRLQELVASGRIGSLSPRFYGIPTEYSQRKTNEIDTPEVLRLCREDGVDASILVAL